MPIKKRTHAIRVGETIYIHKKVYKRLKRRKAELDRILGNVKIRVSFPSLDIRMAQPTPFHFRRMANF